MRLRFSCSRYSSDEGESAQEMSAENALGNGVETEMTAEKFAELALGVNGEEYNSELEAKLFAEFEIGEIPDFDEEVEEEFELGDNAVEENVGEVDEPELDTKVDAEAWAEFSLAENAKFPSESEEELGEDVELDTFFEDMETLNEEVNEEVHVAGEITSDTVPVAVEEEEKVGDLTDQTKQMGSWKLKFLPLIAGIGFAMLLFINQQNQKSEELTSLLSEIEEEI